MTRNTRDTDEQGHPRPERLSDYLDGDVPREARGLLETHLATCAACRVQLDELRAVVARARTAGEGPEPSRDLWIGIAPRLTPRHQAWWRRATGLDGGAWHGRAAVLALAACCLVGAVWVVQYRDRRPGRLPSTPVSTATVVAPAERDYDDTVADLLGIVRTRLTHDPQVLTVLEQNLDAIDVAIADYRDLLATQPEDSRLRNRVAAARERKLEILKRAAALSEVTN